MKEYFEKNIQPELDNLNSLLASGNDLDSLLGNDTEDGDNEYDTVDGLLDPHYVNYEQE